jgi:hypothetical protein
LKKGGKVPRLTATSMAASASLRTPWLRLVRAEHRYVAVMLAKGESARRSVEGSRERSSESREERTCGVGKRGRCHHLTTEGRGRG